MRRSGSRWIRPWALATLLLLSCAFCVQAQNKDAAKEKPAPPPMKLKVGDMAPDFTLLAFDGHDLNKISLHDFRGKKDVALAFYVFAFTGG